MRLAPLIVALAAAALLAGCGDSTTTTGGADNPIPKVQTAWERASACEHPPGASRWGCSVGSYRCQGVVTDRGWSISCAKPGRSVAFTVRPHAGRSD
ncbi:MAG TPA: hypothetical protein VFJ61_02410 [Solirubrobacterales bacterium]|nr:hypothetical protein [Solirubrobacterales bacterium]